MILHTITAQYKIVNQLEIKITAPVYPVIDFGPVWQEAPPMDLPAHVAALTTKARAVRDVG